jgi:HK97 family phage major capsid protein
MTTMLQRLANDRKEKLTFIEGLTNVATSETRDLSSNELELITRAKDRIAEIDNQIETVAVDSELSERAQASLAKLAGATVGTSSVDYKTPGAYLRDYLGSIIGDGELKSASEDRLRRYHRAAAHVTTASFAGAFPDPIVGPLINFVDTSRPLVNALGTIPIPSGPSFRRPRLVDSPTGTGMAIQANEKDELASKGFTVTSDSVDLQTAGGYCNVSRQLLDWGIASMDAIVTQLARRYAYMTERMAVTELQKSTSAVPLAADADSATTIKAIYQAAGLVYQETAELPTVIATGPVGWAQLGSLSTTDGGMAFPFLNPVNAAGSMSPTSFAGNPVGLRLVVSPAITTATFWVLNSAALEIYEQIVGQLSVVEPSVLGTQVSYSGYVGHFRPAPNGAVKVGA